LEVLLTQPERRETLARRAREVIASHRGATQRTARVAMGLKP
jgi:hypothetical protein